MQQHAVFCSAKPPQYPIYRAPKIQHTAVPGYVEEVTVKCILNSTKGSLHVVREGKKLKLTFFKDDGKAAVKLNSLTIEEVRNALASPSKMITTNIGTMRNIRSSHLEKLVNLDK